MRRFDYSEFGESVLLLAKHLKPHNFEAIVFAARGGSFLAGALAYALNIRTMYAINCKAYDGQTKLTNVVLSPLPTIAENNLLFIDEIVDSGETLFAIKEAIKDKNLFSASLFQRTSSKTKADFALYETDEWIDFFWEDFEKITLA